MFSHVDCIRSISNTGIRIESLPHVSGSGGTGLSSLGSETTRTTQTSSGAVRGGSPSQDLGHPAHAGDVDPLVD